MIGWITSAGIRAVASEARSIGWVVTLALAIEARGRSTSYIGKESTLHLRVMLHPHQAIFTYIITKSHGQRGDAQLDVAVPAIHAAFFATQDAPRWAPSHKRSRDLTEFRGVSD